MATTSLKEKQVVGPLFLQIFVTFEHCGPKGLIMHIWKEENSARHSLSQFIIIAIWLKIPSTTQVNLTCICLRLYSVIGYSTLITDRTGILFMLLVKTQFH